MWNAQWAQEAACRGRPDDLFVQGAEQNRAKQLCNACEVKAECLAEALDHRIEWGVWGGMTERERRALLRRRPHVTRWHDVLKPAREEPERGTDRQTTR
ncbi:WhiB family transcriptional regulator [Aeromicrobium sp. PE09-221]|uniref:WhiB family transcriptional regulator n=1 Tax=Aeromicrobium sp. PE09-221 TaxID=1898043 RepID=UPI000B3EC0F5|nr:WhiB family transcriptional regulator [Aeromicrobium sp. PE09-221]OUZ10093.1 WhiB family transcriptional regulator [Aeromicrobium sp. PE09-221]